MAYCRFGEDSDVYVVGNIDGYIDCCGCPLEGSEPTQYIFRRDMIRHLDVHRSLGHKVPDYVYDRLEGEIESHGNEYDPVPIPQIVIVDK